MNEKEPSHQPDYGVRLTGDDLAAHQQQRQPNQPGADTGTEYGPQGQQPDASEYGPQGGFHPPQQQPGYHQPGFQQPGFQQPGFQQPPSGTAYGQPGPGFGGPALHPEMRQEPARPRVLNISFWAIIAAGIAYLLSQLVILSLPNRGFSAEDIALYEDWFSPMLAETPFDNVEAYLNSSITTAAMVVQAVIFLVAYVLVALGIRNGWRSMRILGTVFAGLSLLNFTVASPLAGVLMAAAIVLGIVGIVYAWLPASTEYYRKKAWQKAAKRAYPEVPSR